MSAEGTRRWRADKKLGLKTLQGCKVDEVGLTELLISAGHLAASESDDWKAVGKATARLLERIQIVHLQRFK